jgi:hypothetical protein
MLIGIGAYSLATVWVAPGPLLLLKLPTIGLAIPAAFLLLGEFTPGEIALACALIRRQMILPQDPI